MFFTNAIARQVAPYVDLVNSSNVLLSLKNKNLFTNANTAKIYVLNLERLGRYLPYTTYQEWHNALDMWFRDVVDMVLKATQGLRDSKGKELGLSCKRAFLDASIFVIEILINSDFRHFSGLMTGKELGALLKARQDLDMQIFEENFSSDAPILPRDVMKQRILAKYALGTRARCVLLLYLEVPLRDDAQLRIWQGDIAAFLSVPEYSNLLLTDEDFDDKTLPSKPFSIWIGTSKTIGLKTDGTAKNHKPFLLELSQELTDAIWAYLTHHGMKWSPGMNEQYIFGKQKLSQTIVFWTKELGVFLERTRQGKKVKCGAGVGYFRRLHRLEAEEKGIEAMAETARLSGHTKETAKTKYRGQKRSFEEAQT